MSSKGTIAILTRGGDVPGLNPAIRAVTLRAIREGYNVLGTRRGWEEHSCTPRGLDQVIYQRALCRRMSKKNRWMKSMMLRRRC